MASVLLTLLLIGMIRTFHTLPFMGVLKSTYYAIVTMTFGRYARWMPSKGALSRAGRDPHSRDVLRQSGV